MSDKAGQGFLDTVGLAFLRRRLHSRRLRAAAVRGVKMISSGAGGPVHIDFDDTANAYAQIPPWLDAHNKELAAATAPPTKLPRVPSLSIVIMVVGSRGDVQPFLPIGCRLAERHRVRLATDREFRPMVEGAGLEFYPLGGNPHELMESIIANLPSYGHIHCAEALHVPLHMIFTMPWTATAARGRGAALWRLP